MVTCPFRTNMPSAMPPLSATIIPLYDRHADTWHRRRSAHASLEEPG
jgi:hypothetical protein